MKATTAVMCEAHLRTRNTELMDGLQGEVCVSHICVLAAHSCTSKNKRYPVSTGTV